VSKAVAVLDPVSDPVASAAELDAVFDPAVAALGTWLDVSGSTLYDKLFLRLAAPAGTALGLAAVEVPGCGTGPCGKVAFGKLKATDVVEGEGGRLKLLAYARDTGCAEFTVSVEGVTDGAVTLPLPGFSTEWTTHILGEGVSLQALSQRAEDVITSKAELDALDLESKTFELTGALPGEKAVLTYKRKPGNTRMLYWLPGRNCTFMHAHVVPALLDAGYDVFAMEHHKIGRAQIGCSRRDFDLTSHATDLKVYMQEFDAGLEFALALGAYEKVVLYGHSTGGLEASVFLREGRLKGKIDACILNSPFLDWGNGGAEECLLDSIDEIYPLLKLVGVSPTYSLSTQDGIPTGWITHWLQYPATDLRCRNFFSNTLTAGWAAACSHMHDELKRCPPADVPTLLLHTDGDTVLQHGEIAALGREFCVEGKLVTKHIPNCRHDMLLSYFPAENEKALAEIIGFLKASLG